MTRFFRGGVHPNDFKSFTEQLPLQDFGVPSKVVILLSQHIGAPAQAVVAPGDMVKRGTLVGRAGGFVSTNVHASVAGKVTAVADYPSPLGVAVKAVTIQPEGDDVWADTPKRDPNSLTPAAIREAILEAGIVGMGGATFPTHVKVSPPENKPIDTLIINGVECEPFVTADHRLMLEEPQRILEGLRLLLKAVGASRAVIAIEGNKPDAFETMTKLVANEPNVTVRMLPVRYPQGAEKQLIMALLRREVPSKGLPMDVGVVVQNVATTAAIADAILRGQPVTERLLTVVGDAVGKPGNFRVRVGTLVSELLARCQVAEDYRRLIIGGPMMGLSQPSPDIPVTKGTNCILVSRSARMPPQNACIRCGRCVEVCPSQLVPSVLSTALESRNIDAAAAFNMLDCIECGCCAYVCPSKRAIVQQVKFGKAQLNARKKKA